MFKNFLTDMTSSLLTGQGQQCQDFEVNAMECIEYYGAHQGMEACKDWYETTSSASPGPSSCSGRKQCSGKDTTKIISSIFRGNAPGMKPTNLLQSRTATKSPG